ncbi:dimethylaniline monooxygenase [N-oxide-forming] 2-like [Xenopus laevis]|uniref:Flavin-containing monooxygenase n=1 Tax=Xenopus laevis TaxID=8355 RepID=A0A8J0V2L4_XENLA|nr:dimethylaniline monooxygenase [N-oxide-forming] 2-like [Xenopus laevis]XP_018114112.1 dimethylaniline monooxygenase [N-oxide-forming] 2-like [Xenopus laevis]
MIKKVAIIGAGCSGLTAIKCCLDEGLEPVCFEKSSDIGGLWRFTESVDECRPSLYKSVVTNTSKEMMCYTDFPMPDDFPAYLHNSKVLEYLRLYAKRFNLLKYIQYQTEVCSVTKCSDFPSTGRWDIVTLTNGAQKNYIFDALLICNGHHSKHYLPLDSFPGIEKFKGHYIHSRFYKDSTYYQGKTVLVVGIGNSAGDIAVEISTTAKQVYVSTRRGSWVLSRISKGGLPIDMMLSTRFFTWIRNSLPSTFAARLNENMMNTWFDHANYGLEPLDRAQLKEPMVNDFLPSCILCGTVKIKPQIKAFTESSVIFEDDTVVENMDEVIFATGYTPSFPFLKDPKIIDDINGFLYKQVFPTHIEKPTLAFLGFVHPLGAILPVAELQARWATRIFKGIAHLPTVARMEDYIKKSMEFKTKWFAATRNQKLQSYFIDYMDEVAVEIDVRPNIMQLLLKDPLLAWTVCFGPSTPYQYRLNGPGMWSGAKKAISSQWERTVNPTRTRLVNKSPESGLNLKTLLSLCVLLVAILFGMYCINGISWS